MRLRVLIVDSDAEETLFLQDVLAETQESGHWTSWIGSWVEVENIHAPTWADARAILGSERIDVVLLSLNLEDAHGADLFRHAQALFPHVPFVLLVPEPEAPFAIRLIREGAQDFAIPTRIECSALAHVMLNAIERQRILTSLRVASYIDPLTGLLCAAGFMHFAERDRRLAERLGRRLMLLLAEPRSIAEIVAAQGERKKDLILIETADRLRGLIGGSDLIGRISDSRFGLAVFDTPVESVEAAWSRIHLASADHGIDIGAAILDTHHPAGLEALFDQAARELAPGNAMPAGASASLHKTASMRP